MKPKLSGLFLLGIVLSSGVFFGWAQSESTQGKPNSPRSFLDTPLLTNSAYAQALVSELLKTPVGKPVIPVADSYLARLHAGTYWSLQKSNQPPWPGQFFPELPTYELLPGHFVVDDRAVDYPTLHALRALEIEAAGGEMMIMGGESFDYSSTTNLWLEIPTNGVASNLVQLIVHNTSEALPYTLLTKTALALPTWTPELIITGAVGNATSTQLPQNGRTNLFVWAYEGLPASYLTILSQPLDQELRAEDMVTFSVTAVAFGGGELTYQWTFNGTNIPGATASSHIIDTVWGWHEGDYAVIVSNGDFSVRSRTAHLTVHPYTGITFHTRLFGARQNYRFKRGHTYYIGVEAEFYGHTIIEGGAVIKFDTWYSSARMIIKGTLECRSEPYFPTILTMVDDDSAGPAEGWSTGDPFAFPNGYPFLDLTEATGGIVISNLHFRFADHGVSVPAATGQLDIWNCQFYQCNAAVENQAGDNARIGFHNVLLAQCHEAVIALTNNYAIEAEHLTANVANFWIAAEPPGRISLTNSLIYGAFTGGGIVHAQNTLFNVTNGMFEPREYGHYYLTNTSPAVAAGTTNISPALLSALRQRTTRAPAQIPIEAKVAGEMALFPTVPRHTNGAPDLGYYYPALDYLVADLILKNGTITIHPGTAIAAGNGRQPDGSVSAMGLWLENGAHLLSRGRPDQPNIFTVASLIQEEPPTYFSWFGQSYGILWLVLRHNPLEEGDIVPRMEFEHTKFYLPFKDYLAYGGYRSGLPSISYDCLVDWNLKDCALSGGKIFLTRSHPFSFSGEEYLGSSTINWRNSLFETVTIELDPSKSQAYGTIDCDLALLAEHNLFRGGAYFTLRPLPASAGNWQFRDNLFDQVHFIRTTSAPLEMDHNAYWPVRWDNFLWGDEVSLPLPEGGTHEVTFSSAPPYENGPYGTFYLPMLTPLYHAASRTAADAGLSQYTVRADQITEGQDYAMFGNNMATIGLHYLATTNVNSTVPKDADGDGVPDYVEDANGNGTVDANETSPVLAQTVSGVHDSTNSVYDDIDLSGNGLVGRIKKALGLNPLEANNPLTLKPVATGEEPDFATFEVPVSYDAVTNTGTLSLKMNGAPVTLEECTRATNGNCLLSFNVAFDPGGQHFLASEFRLNSDPRTEHPVMVGNGRIRPFYSSNPVQFFESGSMFDDSGAFLDAKLFEANADYQIELYDLSVTPPMLIKTITNSTYDGTIQEDWDLTMADGVTLYTNDSVQAVFRVAYGSDPGNASTNTPKKYLTKAQGSLSEGGGNMNVVYFRLATNDAWASAYAKPGAIWKAMQGVVDALIKPVWPYPVYQSYFNRYVPPLNSEYPGYITKRARTTNDSATLPTVLDTLLPSMTNAETKQIFMLGHGINGWLGNHDGTAYITAPDVSRALKNTYSKTNLVAQNPYRFVFLDGCATASGPDWRRAFGIYPIDTDNQGQAKRNKTGAQAYVGWADVVGGGINRQDYTTLDIKIAEAGIKTLQTFYVNWMGGFSVKECIDIASQRGIPNQIPFPVPGNKSVIVLIDGFPYTFDLKTSKIYIVGYPGLTATGRKGELDTDVTYAAPKNIE